MYPFHKKATTLLLVSGLTLFTIGGIVFAASGPSGAIGDLFDATVNKLKGESIATDSIPLSKLAPDSVTSLKIANGTINISKTDSSQIQKVAINNPACIYGINEIKGDGTVVCTQP